MDEGSFLKRGSAAQGFSTDMERCCRQEPLALSMSDSAFTDCLQLDEGNALEQSQAQRCRARIEHLNLNLGDKDTQRTWANARVNRILVDYMLRNSYYDTAVKYAEATRIKVRENKHSEPCFEVSSLFTKVDV
jgi:hypothetical protein